MFESGPGLELELELELDLDLDLDQHDVVNVWPKCLTQLNYINNPTSYSVVF
jgi:hypothetical protein